MQGYDVGVRAESFERLDLSELVYLVYGLEVFLHTFYGHELVSRHMLGFEDLRKCAFSFLTYEPIFVHFYELLITE